MTMLQHYYTSTVRGLSGRPGFQDKAASIGLTEEDLQAIHNLIGYRIPPSLAAQPVSQHPPALRYIILSPEKCLLTCSQSCGADELGRPGNFFAHTILTHPQDFDVFPPIFFWRHPQWRIGDPEDRSHLPVQPAFDWPPSLDLEQVWAFLDSPGRQDWFYRLLCAVLRCQQERRPVIIRDDTDHVALWIAAASVALPRLVRPHLTFATYHHDPYQATFWITGTTAETHLHLAPNEDATFFVLNTFEEQVTLVEPSAYAEFVCENLHPAGYETRLLNFFEFCNNRLSESLPAQLETILSDMANLYQALYSIPIRAINSQTWRSLNDFLDTLETIPRLTQDDLTDLHSCVDWLNQLLDDTPSIRLVAAYSRALHLLRQHDTVPIRAISHDLDLLMTWILSGEGELAEAFETTLLALYPPATLSRIANQSDRWARLAVCLPGKDTEQGLLKLALFWRLWPRMTLPEAGSQPWWNTILEKTLFVLGSLPIDPAIPESAPSAADPLLEAWASMNDTWKRTLLEWAAAGGSQSNDIAHRFISCLT